MSLWETIQWYWGNILDYGLQMLPCMLIGVFGFLLFLPSRKRRLASLGLSKQQRERGCSAPFCHVLRWIGLCNSFSC